MADVQWRLTGAKKDVERVRDNLPEGWWYMGGKVNADGTIRMYGVVTEAEADLPPPVDPKPSRKRA